jgi:hypothetical protein
MATRMQQRRGTAAQWTSANPILSAGEIGFETDTGKFKIGNGSSTWSALNYYVDANSILDGAPGVLDTLNELAAAIGDDPAFFTTIGTDLSDHTSATTSVHGIADTANLVTLAGNQTLTNKTLTSPTLNGSPIANTADSGDSSGRIATTLFVQQALADLINSAPGALDTLNELAAALGDDPNFATTVTDALATKLNLSGGTMTGVLSLSGNPTESFHASNKSYVDDSIGTHSLDTTNVHGIADTADLATKTYADNAVSTHSGDSTSVHGIANTADLATKSYADNAASGAISTHNSDTTNVHGIADTSALATSSDVSDAQAAAEATAAAALAAHEGDSTNVHGIANTADLATKTYADNSSSTAAGTAQTAAELTASNALTAHNNDTTDVHGISNTGNIVFTDDSRLSDTRTPTDDTVSTAKIINLAVTDAKLAADAVTTAKILDGAVTSAKIADGTIVNADINASAAIDWTKLAVSSTVSETELGYLDGVTSAVQTQLDAKYSSASATTDLALKAPLASPALTGTPTAPTATLGTNTTQVATTAFVKAEVDAVIAAAPGALNTLDELAAALGDDANFATTVTNSLAAKAPLASPTFTGTVTLPAAGIVFSDGTQAKEGVPSRTTINSVTDTYNLSTGGLTLRDTLIECNKATGFTVTIPANSTTAFPVGTSIDLLQVGAGQVTIAGAAGVTVNATPGLKLRAQWSSATLFKRATDTWVVMGDLSA